MNDILYINLNEIAPPSVVMMYVDTQALSYMELRDSIRQEGILQNLTVKHNPNGNYIYELVTGHKRYTIAKELGLETVPCMILEAPGAEMIIKQIQENCCREAPSHLQLADHFKRLLLLQPNLTYGDLAGLINKSPTMVRKILALDRLTPSAKKLVEDNILTLVPAVALSKLPPSLQDDIVDEAADLQPIEFLHRCRRVKQRYNDAMMQGKLIENDCLYTKQIEPQLRSLTEIKKEYNNLTHGQNFLDDNPDLDPLEIWKGAITWVIRLDPTSEGVYLAYLKRLEDAKHKRLATKSISRKAKELAKQLYIKVDSVTLRLAQEFIF